MTNHAQTLSLEVVSVSPTRVVQLRLHGQDGVQYVLETSPNVASWQSATVTTVTTTNGVALVSHKPGRGNNALFFRARRIVNVAPNPQVIPKISPKFSVTSVVTPEGGRAELTMPDFRRIILSIPPACVGRPSLFTMTLVTNFDNFPFSRGTLGAVRLEPEGFILNGAASLEIDFPSTNDTHQLVSFGMYNDGSDFHPVLDRIQGNRTLIPITYFATYGTSLATLSELQSVLKLQSPVVDSAGSQIAKQNGPAQKDCPQEKGFNPNDTSRFPDSSVECFADLVSRALYVRKDLHDFLRCNFSLPMAAQLADARNQQLSGSTEVNDITDFLTTNVCNIYAAKIQPLWQEAKSNCALNLVLLETMLGFERQLQQLGVTNAPCTVTLADNVDALCEGARACFQETKLCCILGIKGVGKLASVLGVLRQFQLLGYDCFPDGPGGSTNPDVSAAFAACTTNTWVGTFSVVETGGTNKTSTTSSSTISYLVDEQHSLRLDYGGIVWQSAESPDVPIFDDQSDVELVGTQLSLLIVGDASATLHDRSHTRSETKCLVGGHQVSEYESTIESYAVHNVPGSTATITNNIVDARGTYQAAILIKPDQTYELMCAGPLIPLTVKSSQLVSDTDCKDDVKKGTTEEIHTNFTGALFPPLGFPPVIRPMPNSNVIAGTYTTTDETYSPPTKIKFTWYFERHTNSIDAVTSPH